MPTITELRDQRTKALQSATAIRDKAKGENREVTEAEAADIEKAVSTADGLRGQIAAATAVQASLDRLAAAESEAAEVPAPRSEAPLSPTAPIGSLRAREAVLGDPKRGYKSFGEFARDVFSAGPQGVGSSERLRIASAATGMNASVGAEGAFLMPPDFSKVIWDGLNTGADSLLARVDRYDIEGESLTFPANAETSRVTGSRYGGIRGYWLAEADQMTASKPKFRQLKLEPQGLAVLCYVTDKLLKGGGSALAQYLTRAATEEIQFLVSDAIIRGTGVGQPLGLLNSGSLITVNKGAGQANDTFTQQNAADMWARLHVRARAGAVWLINQDVEPQLLTMVTVVKNVAGTENVGGFSAGLYDPKAKTLCGAPVIPVEYCATLGDLGDVILWSPGSYAAGVRGGGVDAAESMHLRFDYAETAFRFLFAVDGQPWLKSALTPFKGAATLGTHIVLQAR